MKKNVLNVGLVTGCLIAGLIVLLALVSYGQGRLSLHGQASQDAHTWLVALKHNADEDTPLRLASDVVVRWEARPLGMFIGEPPVYWTQFALLGSDRQAALPLVLDSRYQDAYVVKLDKDPVPLVLTGALSLLHQLGVLSEPEGAVIEDVSEVAIRPDIGPSNASVQALLAEPAHYQPAMINFLSYFDRAIYPASTDESPVSGAEAYLQYGKVALRSAYSIGAEIIVTGLVSEVVVDARGGFQANVDSGINNAWDSIAIMQYPSPPAILSLEKFERYRQSLADRNAGLARTIVVSSLPRENVMGNE